MKTTRQRTVLLVLALAAPLLIAGAARGAPAAGAAGSTEIKEQSIYIPYEKLREVFEKEGRGVFLPYEKFLELWKAARQTEPEALEAGPPVDSLVTEVAGVATVSKDVVTVKADVKIDVLKEGWNEVPLRLRDVAITKAMIGTEPARLLSDGGGYRLLFEKKGKAPQSVGLALEFAKAYAKAPGQNSVSFECPMAPVSRWDVRIPESGVKVNIHPMLAATEVPGAAGVEETHVLAFVGAAPEVRIEWTPKAEGARGLEALASAKAEQQVWIDEGVTRSRIRLVYEISRAQLGQLVVDVPADQKVVNVFDPNVREWSVAPAPAAEGASAAQRITVQLFEPAKGAQNLVIELEKFAAAGGEAAPAAPATRAAPGSAEIIVPVVQAVGVGRQMGVVVVKVAPGLRAEAAKLDRLLQLDAAELPPELARTTWDFSYRYATVPYGLVLAVEKILPRILITALTEAHLQPEALTIDFLAVYDVERAGVFQLTIQVPEGYEIRDVQGVSVGGAAAADVDTHHLEGKDLLVVNLSRKALGRVALAVRLYRALAEPDLLAPTGKAATLVPAIPRARSVERETGRLVVYAPESLRVNPAETTGLRTISYDEAVQGMRSTQAGGERSVLSFAYTDGPAALSLAAERRKPQVTVAQLLTARIESGVVKYQATFFYTIRYSGVQSLRIDVPKALADQIRVTTTGVEKELGEEADGLVPINLRRETEFGIGSPRIALVWEEKIEEIRIGKSAQLVIPRLVPRNVDLASGQIVLAKAETIDVAPTDKAEGLTPIDPQTDLIEGQHVAGAARAFEFHDDWTLMIKATRYGLKETKPTSIERALVRMVATRGAKTNVQAIYRMRSARQRLAIQLPGTAEFESKPVRIDGRPVSLEEGDEKGQYFVPLTGQNPDEAFHLEVRYYVKGGGLRLECPAFPMEPAVQRVYLEVFVPTELVYLGSTGPWNPELVWTLSGFNARPRANQTSESLIAWVFGDPAGIANYQAELKKFGESLGSFETDGRHLLYSTLRPPAGPEGALRIVAMSQVWFNILVVLVVLAVGAWLIRERLARRALVVGAAVVLMVFLAVFFPSFARAVTSYATVAACFVVAVAWVVWHIVVTRPRDPALQARRKAREEARLAEAKARAEVAKVRLAEVQARRAKAAKPKDSGGKPKAEGGEGHA